MAMKSETNASLYFIVGGLVVLAIIFGFLFFAENGAGVGGLGTLEPMAGEEVIQRDFQAQPGTPGEETPRPSY